MTQVQRNATFALLDDCDATAERRSSRLYTGFAHEHACTDGAQLDAVCAAVQRDLDAGLHAVVLAAYEFGRNLQLAQPGDAALRFLLFRDCAFLSAEEAGAWLAKHDDGAVAGVAGIEPSVTREAFNQAIDAIHDALRAGDSYQVNFTMRLAFDVFGTPLALYRRLRPRQPVRYGALIALPEASGRAVLSCSPELFIEKQGDTLRARPMKGTAPRDVAPEFLSGDPKNRAENVMIVDLLRNDMSRVAVTGSVRVPALFSVEPYNAVWQMTSTIEARVRPGTGFADLLRALFPCGSITGAPKYKTMQLIDAIESTPRGLYTGAIGWLDRHGDLCLSVAIRTLLVNGARGEMGVGAGIVLDSVAGDEFEECRLKASFLTGADPGFALFETTFATRGGVRHLERHLARLDASARYFGFPCDFAALRAAIEHECADFDAAQSYRLRVELDKSGAFKLTHAPLAPLAHDTVDVLLAPDHGFAPQCSDDPLLRHKTTRREQYDRAWRAAESAGAFDMLFFNERGEVTEGGRTNVFVQLDGVWGTPPLAAGLLPGVMRGVLIEELGAVERPVSRADLERAGSIVLCNALRGAVNARLR